MEKALLPQRKFYLALKNFEKYFRKRLGCVDIQGSSTDESTPRVSHAREGMPVGGVVGFTKERCPFQKSRHNQQDWIVITNKITDFFFQKRYGKA
jgi:hypothetical protein